MAVTELLLKKVHQYYPIGLPHLFHYEGYNELKKLIAKKIDHLINKDRIEPWTSLVDDLLESSKPFGLTDHSYVQLPSYVLSIDISDDTRNQLKNVSSLVLTVSLLDTCFTVYFENIISFEKASGKFLPVAKIISAKQNDSEIYKNLFGTVTDKVANHFPAYRFIDHTILFNSRVLGGIPYGQSVEDFQSSYAIFDYLFGRDNFWYNKTTIVD